MYNASDKERDVLSYWDKTNTFKRSIDERPEKDPYVFYDGPPFATGMPHYGHLMAGTRKDVVLRYHTMQGKRIRRQWGWDCHGLPIENLVEKELGLSGPKDIEEYGIAKFNEACRDKVLMYADEWQKIIPRFGRWIDMEKPYKTMDKSFMESVWWVFGELFDKGLVYEGKRAMHICPRCVTPLSNFEVSQGYKDIKDLSVTAKFTLKENPFGSAGQAHMLAWTTTPWTLPGNVLLAVGEDITYTVLVHEGDTYVVAKDLVLDVFGEKPFEVIDQVPGSKLVGLHYEPVFPYYASEPGMENAYKVVTADFVTTDDGTGIVHIAPAFGDDDYQVFKEHGVPFIQHVGMDGVFAPEVTDFAGMHVKPKEDHMATDVEIVKWLAHNGKLFSKKKYEHSYPHCWRCDTPLLNFATDSWFVKVTDLKDDLLKANGDISWTPEHIKEGRFGKWLEGVKDWSISRNRYWGTPIPIWKSNDGDVLCVRSAAELEELTGKSVDDLHRHFIDELTIEKGGKTYHRIPDVLDTWFDSGSVPYGQYHYPFENKDEFERSFPADFIAESQDQTRGWFYTLHVLAVALTHGDNRSSIPGASLSGASKHISCNGIILAEDGRKMSKRLQNYPDPVELVEKYGADAIRTYLMGSPVMQAESLNFSEDSVREVYNKLVNTTMNVVSFYQLVSTGELADKDSLQPTNVLDTWMLARLAEVHQIVSEAMNTYQLPLAVRSMQDFVTDLSQWYVRRSRDRMKDAKEGVDVFGVVLYELSKLLAPFAPFLAEDVYQEVTGKTFDSEDSVHLELWTASMSAWENDTVIKEMALVRKAVELGLSARKEAQMRVRQPLSAFAMSDEHLAKEYGEIMADELNVKSIYFANIAELDNDWVKREEQDISVALNIELTDELVEEGLVREVVRAINGKRKELGLTPSDRATGTFHTQDEDLKKAIEAQKEQIMSQTKLDELEEKEGGEPVKGLDIAISLEKK